MCKRGDASEVAADAIGKRKERGRSNGGRNCGWDKDAVMVKRVGGGLFCGLKRTATCRERNANITIVITRNYPNG